MNQERIKNIRKEIKFRIKNITTTILENLKPGDKIIRTKDRGDFKVRKNGKYILKIGNDIIRVTPIKKEKINEKIIIKYKNRDLILVNDKKLVLRKRKILGDDNENNI